MSLNPSLIILPYLLPKKTPTCAVTTQLNSWAVTFKKSKFTFTVNPWMLTLFVNNIPEPDSLLVFPWLTVTL